MNEKAEIKTKTLLGTDVFLKPEGNALHRLARVDGKKPLVIQGRVTKAARKYIYVETKEFGRLQFTVDDLTFVDVSESNMGFTLFLTLEDYEKYVVFWKRRNIIKEYFDDIWVGRTRGMKLLSYEGLDKIYAIMSEEGVLTQSEEDV